ncbi:MAG: DDE-type integrase/transposase/recombinase [Thermoplasmata archaeon]|nr:DDE-type integrase/transposase/recombinase [Thermoplasmata archaeon]
MTSRPWADQRTPALAMLARGDQIESVAPAEYSVRSQSRPGVTYRVRSERGRFVCECAFFIETGGSACIHVLAVKFREGFAETARAAHEPSPTCQFCHSGNVVGDGKRRNKSGAVAKYHCRACGGYFSGKEGFHNRRSDPEMIAKALDLYFRGVSFRQVAKHFGQAYGLNLSAMTVYRWVTHYSNLAAEWMSAQGAKVGEVWHVDERIVNVDGEHRYLWNVMDSSTRFLLASRISKGRGVREARAAFKEAKAGTEVRPREIRSDGLAVYPEAIRKESGRYRRAGDPPKDPKDQNYSHSTWTPHKVVPSIRAPESNNILERLNGTSKDRTKTMRAYDNDAGASSLSVGWQVHYNLVRDHLALGTTPGVAAGIAPIPGFRWREIIEAATREAERPEETSGI